MTARRPTVAVSGYFLDRPWTGSGQYSVKLLEWLKRIDPAGKYPTIPSGQGGGALRKLLFEHVSVARAARSLHADLLHVPYLGPPLFTPCPTVVTAHDVIMLALPEHRGGTLYRLYTSLALAAARRARLVLADSRATAVDLERYAGIPMSKTVVVPLGCDEDLVPVTDPAALDSLRAKYGLPGRFLLYLGGFDNRKNLPLLLEALAQIDGDIPLAIAGKPPEPSPPLYPDVRSAAAPLGDRVRWLGRVPEQDKAALYSAATVFVWPSRYEGFGLPPLEAMACGTPVICADASSVPEVTGDAAILVPPDDEASLIAAIRRVLGDDNLQGDLRARGLQRASELTWKRTAELTLAAYHRALSG